MFFEHVVRISPLSIVVKCFHALLFAKDSKVWLLCEFSGRTSAQKDELVSLSNTLILCISAGELHHGSPIVVNYLWEVIYENTCFKVV